METVLKPTSMKEIKAFLREKFFPATDFSAIRAKLQSMKQALRESVEDWETRLTKTNDGRIDLSNEEGLLLYRNGVLPVYRFEVGTDIIVRFT